jgi:hypothetical protein
MFAALSGGASGAGADSIVGLVTGGDGGASGGGLAATVIQAAAAASGSGSTTQSNSGNGGGSTAATVALDVVKSAFGLVPLASILFGLFGGGGNDAPAPLVKYALPAALDFQAAETASGLTAADYNQSGMPRAAAQGTQAASLPAINVTVQAMDARSFLDRSSEIAAAVREAMLNLNPINDVVTDL